jgi:uncharacterized protein
MTHRRDTVPGRPAHRRMENRTMDDDHRRERARRTVRTALERVLAHDMAGFAALWAPDGTMIFPFAAPGSTERLDGRAAVAAYVEGYPLRPAALTEQTWHDTGDPDTVVLEFAMAGTVPATGKGYALRYVAIVTVGDEGITSYRDYWSPAHAVDVLGVPGLAEVSA